MNLYTRVKSRELTLYTVTLLLMVTSNHAIAELHSRLGGQAYYDDVLNITWLTDANYASTTGYSTDSLGRLSWDDSMSFVVSLNTDNHLGFSDWRLPRIEPVNGIAIDYNFTHDGSTDFGYNISAPGSVFAGTIASELSHLFHNTLGNPSRFDFNGGETGACQPSNCLLNTGPFQNLASNVYWAETEFANNTDLSWLFRNNDGIQAATLKFNLYYAWPVRDGDVLDSDTDGITDDLDNCPSVANPDQLDNDTNGVGDLCELPRIAGFWSSSVEVGQSVTLFIFGEYFDTPAGGMPQVSIGGVNIPLVSAVDSNLLLARFTITTEMIGGAVTISNALGEVSALESFAPASTGLAINGIWPSQASVSDIVFVFGQSYDTTPGATEVRINGLLSTVAQVVSDTLVLFMVPTGAETGPITVSTLTEMATAPVDLLIVP